MTLLRRDALGPFLLAFRRGMRGFVIGLVVLHAALAFVPERVDYQPTGEAVVVENLVARHGCWREGGAPAGVVPRHAVVALPDKEPRLVASDVGFGIWLDGRPGVLYAFCP